MCLNKVLVFILVFAVGALALTLMSVSTVALMAQASAAGIAMRDGVGLNGDRRCDCGADCHAESHRADLYCAAFAGR